MSSSGLANAQARALLQMLCKFMLPLIRMATRQVIDPKDLHFGIEADEFVTELEKFISGIISRSQPRSHDITIEARLDNGSYYRSEEDESTLGASFNDKRNPRHIPMNQAIIRAHAMPHVMPLGANEKALGNKLQDLRKHVMQKMPIRLLCFEPYNSRLKIALLERGDIYNHLVLKLRVDIAPSGASIKWWKPAQYAILSHTWNQTPGELTYTDWKTGSLDATQPKCRKLVNFCKAAYQNHGLTLGWIDTVCINKESSAELDESIRSMYAWYREAEVCITYLARSQTIRQMRDDPWFTRGWTLQELVAPQCIKFYDMDWNQLSRIVNDKRNGTRDILVEIGLATTITPDELLNIQKTSISRRMQLAANRQVTREEDIAYCLMGIFDVSFSTAYGEGTERAFFRLVEEIFRSTKDISDIFNWAGNRDIWTSTQSRQPITSLFPFHPSDYLNRSSNKQLRPWRPIEPLTLTHLGLRTPILLMPAVPLRQPASRILFSDYPPPVGDYHAAVSVVPCRNHVKSPKSNLPEHYLVLDKRVSGLEGMHQVVPLLTLTKEMITLAFGTLNVEEQGNCIHIPKTCIAVLLGKKADTSSLSYKKIHTNEPIVFNLKKTGNNSDVDEKKYYYEIEKSQLANHGMKLVTLYL